MSEEFSANQQIPPPPSVCSGFIYTVQSGDTMFFIAQRFGVSLNALIAANPQIPNPNLIFPGQRICVPSGAVPPPPPPPPPFCSGFFYTVQPGDTLFTIAQRFGTTVNAILAANPQITNPNLIFPGQVICIPTAPPPPPPPPPPPVCPGFFYTVQPGDTLFTIAQRFGTTVNAILAVNPQITNPNLIFPGQVICIPTAPPPPPGEIECAMLLLNTGTVQLVAGGVARVRQFQTDGGNILIGTIFLPDPSTLAPNLTTYVAWVRYPTTTTRVPLTLCDPNNGVWTGVLANPVSPVAPFNDIIVTAEASPTVPAPSGIQVLRGTFANCLPR